MGLREDILEKAICQLRRGGYSQLNFASLSKELGTTRANIHYHFSNKENLAKEALETYREMDQQTFETVFTQFGADFPAAIEVLESELWARIKEDPSQCVCACAPLLSSSEDVPVELTQLAKKHYDDHIAFFAERIQLAQEEGFIKSQRSAQEISQELNCLVMGLMLRSIDTNEIENNPLRKTLSNYVRALKS